MVINYRVYRGDKLLAQLEELQEARFNASISSIMNPQIVTIKDLENNVILRFEDGKEIIEGNTNID